MKSIKRGEARGQTHNGRSVYKMTYKKGAHTQTPPTPLSVPKVVFCVFSLISGTLQRRADEGLSGLKGSNPIPDAVVFGTIRRIRILLFFLLVLTGVSTSRSLKIL